MNKTEQAEFDKDMADKQAYMKQLEAMGNQSVMVKLPLIDAIRVAIAFGPASEQLVLSAQHIGEFLDYVEHDELRKSEPVMRHLKVCRHLWTHELDESVAQAMGALTPAQQDHLFKALAALADPPTGEIK